MYVEVYGTHQRVSDRDMRDRSAVVIDLLRATSCIVEAVTNGARKIIPVTDLSEAIAVSRTLDKNDRVLAGERDSNPLAGFDIGNSPFQFSAQIVGGKTVVISTTNGTGAIERAHGAKNVFIGALLNKTAVAQKLIEMDDDVVLLCAGTEGKISIDDLYCAGGILDAMRSLGAQIQGNDLGTVCELVYHSVKADPSILRKSFHCSRLIELGYDADVEYCLREDLTQKVPVCVGGIIS